MNVPGKKYFAGVFLHSVEENLQLAKNVNKTEKVNKLLSKQKNVNKLSAKTEKK